MYRVIVPAPVSFAKHTLAAGSAKTVIFPDGCANAFCAGRHTLRASNNKKYVLSLGRNSDFIVPPSQRAPLNVCQLFAERRVIYGRRRTALTDTTKKRT